MFSRAPRTSSRYLIGLLAMVAIAGASAQEPAHGALPTMGADPVTLSADLVKTGLYVIGGGGGNSLLRFSASGSILIDAKLPGNYRALMSQVRKISKLSDLPVRALILTDHHENHSGNSAQFAAAGIPIIAQENARQHLPAATAGATSPAAGKPPAPTVTYDRDYRLRMGGVEVQIFHFGNARTNGDSVVHFPDLKVVAVGDLFTPDAPEPDFSSGGSLVGWGPVLAQILKLDFDVVVPSTGPLVTRAALEAFKTKIDLLISRASTLVKNGVAKDQLMAQLKTDDLGWRLNFTGDPLDRFYAELSRIP
jgi:cyclase